MPVKRYLLSGLFLLLLAGLYPFRNQPAQESPNAPSAATSEKAQCVEPVHYMRRNHMTLLYQWRNDVVRNGNRVYVNSDGKSFEKSLQRTCLGCHDNTRNLQNDTQTAHTTRAGQNSGDAKTFCQNCHETVGVRVDCFQCHTGHAGNADHGNIKTLKNAAARAQGRGTLK